MVPMIPPILSVEQAVLVAGLFLIALITTARRTR